MKNVESMVHEIFLEIPVAEAIVDADLILPLNPVGLVVFAHGTGSNRFSPRNRHIAGHMNRAGFATLLMDLLTPGEKEADAETAMYRFDIEMLADRMAAASRWISEHPRIPPLKIGYFGASTGAAAALVAATRIPELVFAVVSRGGRPDLAGQALTRVKAPTLLLVGERDETVADLNRAAMESLECEKKLEVVAGATHLLDEPGALKEVTESATAWFLKHIRSRATSDPGWKEGGKGQP